MDDNFQIMFEVLSDKYLSEEDLMTKKDKKRRKRYPRQALASSDDAGFILKTYMFQKYFLQ